MKYFITNTKKVLCIIFVAIFSLTLFVGCNKKEDTKVDVSYTKYEFTKGIHELTAPEKEGFLANEGKTDYTILLPKTVDSNLILAEAELKRFFEEATGASLKTIMESGAGFVHNDSSKYISIGNTEMFKSSNVDLKEDLLGTQGIRIVTKGNTVYINGNTTRGALYGVYDFLEILFDYDQYTYNMHSISKIRNVALRDFDVTDVPDIEMRAPSWKFVNDNPESYGYRLRTPASMDEFMLAAGDVGNGASRATIHNSIDIIPRNAPTSRESWFSDQSNSSHIGTQICYTAHGIQEDYDALIDRIAYVIEEYSLKSYTPEKFPLKNIVTFTMEDSTNTCNCDSCIAAKNKYGTDSGAVIVLCKRVREKLTEWMNLPENAEYRRDNLQLVFFAYSSFIHSPVHFDDALGKYVVNHPDLEIPEGVGVYYAISSGLQFQKDIYDDASKEGVENSLKWMNITPFLCVWTYNMSTANYLFRTAGTNFYNSNAYQFFASGNTKFMYNQGGWNTDNMTAFQMLDCYIDAKMQWDTTRDSEELIKKWCKGAFKEAGETMYKLYLAENLYALELYDKNNMLGDRTGIINGGLSGKNNWPYGLLRSWLDLIDEARSKIAFYKQKDPEIYNAIKENIDVEWVCPAYFMLSTNDDYLSAEEHNAMRKYFLEEITPLKNFLFSERSTTNISDWANTLVER